MPVTDDDLKQHRVSTTIAHMVTAGLDLKDSVSVGTCPCCERINVEVSRHRLNTAYANDAENWLVSCVECFEDTREYYAELWAEYYNGQGI